MPQDNRNSPDWKFLAGNQNVRLIFESDAWQRKKAAATAVLRKAESLRQIDFANGMLDQMAWTEALIEREAKKQSSKSDSDQEETLRFPLRWGA